MPITYADVYVFGCIPTSRLNQSELRGSLRFMKAGKHSICSLRSVLEKSPILENVPRKCEGGVVFLCFAVFWRVPVSASPDLFAKYSITLLHLSPTGLRSPVQSQVERDDWSRGRLHYFLLFFCLLFTTDMLTFFSLCQCWSSLGSITCSFPSYWTHTYIP